jgi:hypothetical protein
MRFSHKRKVTALALILILGFLPILGAQTIPDFSSVLPETRDLHFPESSVSKATVGTLSGDPDAFMSTLDWSSIENMENVFVLAGVDEYGLALGFAKKFGKLYFGASYSGDLIDELYRRVTNKETGSLLAGVGLAKNDSSISTAPYVYNRFDEPPEDAVATSNNDVNLILGVGIFGLRLGFSEYIRAVNYELGETITDADYAGQDSLETSLKPNLEIGFNIPAGKVTIKPALWGAFDIRGVNYKSANRYYNFDASSPLPVGAVYELAQGRINFMEPSGGLTVDVEIAVSDATSISFGLEGGGAFRLYPGADDPDALEFLSDDTTTPTGKPLGFDLTGVGTATGVGGMTGNAGTIPLDLRASGGLSFGFSSDISERFTLAGKFQLLGTFNWLKAESETAGVTVSATTLAISGAPDLALGASFHLIPDHFSLHAGIGVELFSFGYATADTDPAPTNGKNVTTNFGLPSARFGGGLTVNLTQAVALDAMAFSSGLDLEGTTFNLLLTVKK